MPPVVLQPVFSRRPYSLAFALAYAAWAIPEIVGFVRGGRGGDDAVVADARSTHGILAAVGAVVVGGFLFAAEAPWAGFGPLAVPLFWTGTALAVGGTALRWYAVAVLGGSFSRRVAVGEDQTVVSRGPYAHVRHPTYTGSLAALVGFGLAFGTVLSLLVAVVAGGLAYAYRIRVEERVLVANLDGYDAYREAVPYRLIPYVY